MLQSEVQTAARAAHLDYLGQAALQALTAGATQAELMTSLSAALENYQARQEPLPGLLPCDRELVFDELPEGMIDLPSATRVFGISNQTLHSWVKTGRVLSMGRIRGPARGGGLIVLKKDDILRQIEKPPKRGRPQKS